MTTQAQTHGTVFFKSPDGIARYPRTTVADTRFNAKGVYSIGLILGRADLDATETRLREIFDRAYPDATGPVSLPIRDDAAEGYRYVVAKSTYKPKVMNAERQEISGVEHGAKVRIVGRARPYRTHLAQGVALYVAFVDVIDPEPGMIVGQDTEGTPLPF